MYKYPWLESDSDHVANYEDIEGGYSAVPHGEKCEDDDKRLLQPVMEHGPNGQDGLGNEDPNLVSYALQT